jgi:tRNA pseudouridine55 synthase
MIIGKEHIGSLKEVDFAAGTAILVNKPLDWTSFHVVNKFRWVIRRHLGLKKFKIGHAGTLDPLASGLLILCTGAWTKRMTDFQGLGKRYTGEMTLGATRPSYDMETEIDQTFPTEHITPELIESIRENFIGEFMQMPPIFSAKQIGGQRAYDLARAGKEVKVLPNPVHISSLTFDDNNLPVLGFDVSCGKGTYIRSLAYDVGKALESGAYLSLLCRESIGEHLLENALEIAQFEEELLGSTSL